MKPSDGRKRVIIEEVRPQVDGGRYPVCRVIGDEIVVTAAVFADGHDHVAARLLYKPKAESTWRSRTMTPTNNDLWTGSFKVDQLGGWNFTIEGWIDHFDTWVSDLRKRLEAQSGMDGSAGIVAGGKSDEKSSQDIPLAFRTGAALLADTAKRATGADAKHLDEVAAALNLLADQKAGLYDDPISPEIEELVARYPDLTHASRYSPEVAVRVDRERARFSAWYELFPRSTSPIPG